MKYPAVSDGVAAAACTFERFLADGFDLTGGASEAGTSASSQPRLSLMHYNHCKAHDTRSRNWHHKSTPFSGTDFWYVCHTNLALDSSGTRFQRRLDSGTRVTWPKNQVNE